LNRLTQQSEIANRQSTISLLRLLVRRVAPALSAKLLEFESIRSLLLILGCDVIPVLAFGALKRDVISWHNSPKIADCDVP
jgi:hypothetical protein